MTDRYIDFPPKSKNEGENIRADIKSAVDLAKSGVVIKKITANPDHNMVDKALRKMHNTPKNSVDENKRGETVR
ncbi:MAG TPA: hypothetical protein VLE44_03015 [Candidatus Saccharimonadales bacterium]|nr:hypothetical protein [Candidatus Saccharimonadales bacterium]